MVHLQPEREKRQGQQRLAAWASSVENIPVVVSSPELGVNAVRRSGDQDAACASPPPATRWAPKPVAPHAAQVAWTHRDLASTGTRSQRFGKQTSDERIGGCLSGGALQGATSREVPSPKEADTWWEDFLTTRVSGDRAKTVRQSSAVANKKVFARRLDSWVAKLARVEIS